MSMQRLNKLLSVFVFALVLSAAGHAQAQWGFSGISSPSELSQFGIGYGAWPAYGASPYGNGFGPFAGTSNFIGFPHPAYRLSTGQTPLTTTSFPSVSNAVTLVPGWGAFRRRLHRRHQAQFGVSCAALRQ